MGPDLLSETPIGQYSAEDGRRLSQVPSTLNPQPSTLNPQPSKLNTQHSTLNTQHSTLTTQHSPLNTQHSTLITQHSTLNTQHSTLIPLPGSVCEALLGRGHPEACREGDGKAATYAKIESYITQHRVVYHQVYNVYQDRPHI